MARVTVAGLMSASPSSTLPAIGTAPDPTGSAGAGPIASLWRVREFVRPYWGTLAFSIGSALVGVGLGISVPLVIRRVVDGPLSEPGGAANRGALLQLSLLALVLGVSETILAFLRRWTQESAVFGMERDLRDAIYRHLQSLPPSFHDGWLSGQLLSRAVSDLSTIRRFSGFGFTFLIVNIATFIAICGVLLHLDLSLGLVVCACLLPLTWICRRFQRVYSTVSRRVQDQQGDLTTTVEEAATGVRVIKAFGRRRLVAERFDTDATAVRSTQLEKVRLRAGLIRLLDVLPNATLGLVLLVGAHAVGTGRLSVGSLVAFITLTLQLVWPVQSLGFILASAQEAGTACQRVYEVLDTVPGIRSPEQGEPTATTARATPRVPQARRSDGSATGVRFEDVEYRYPQAARPVLSGVTLDVRPGETLALVGASGSGKTTLAMLVPRLADATRGRVVVGDRDVRDVPLTELRTTVATAFEEPILFSASVRENVTLGRPEATDDDVDAALALAQAGFAYDLPWGLDTRVGEQGMSLSGGQRQRLALARAVLGRPQVLVLDDPLSALDVETEALVEEALRRVLSTTTAIVVVHRPSTVALADRVALLHEGRVAAVGTHRELLAEHPVYADLMGEVR